MFGFGQTPYEFPAPLFWWHQPHLPATDPADGQATCQWRAFDDVSQFGHGTYTTTAIGWVEILCPSGLDIWDGFIASVGQGDYVARQDTPVLTYYQVQWLELNYVGFPKECYRIVARRVSTDHDTPLV